LEQLDEYRRVLEHFSRPRLDLIEWKPAENNNIEVLRMSMNNKRNGREKVIFRCLGTMYKIACYAGNGYV